MRKVVKKKLKNFCLLVVLTFSTSCQINYYMKSAYHQLKLLNQRKPLIQAQSDPKLSAEEKRKIELAKEVLSFTKNTLKLNTKSNYSSYVKLDRSHVTYVVNASPKWELKNYNWDYFWVGQMPYKGFFNKEEAQSEAENLRQKNLDVFLRGVSAYSTLGWFNDPILSSMLRYEDWDLVDTIIHETVHANLYIKNNAEFNEQLATFIGLKGMELFYKNKEGANSETLIKARQEAQDQKIFREFLYKEVQILKEFYSRQNKTELNETERQQQLDKIKNKYYLEIKPKIQYSNYDSVFNNQFNNAFLMLYMTYNQGYDDFEKLWTKVDSDFEKFYKEIQALEKSKDPVQDLKKLL